MPTRQPTRRVTYPRIGPNLAGRCRARGSRDQRQLLELAGLSISLLWTISTSLVRMRSTSIWLDEAYSLSALNDLHLYMRADGGDMLGYIAFLIAWSHLWSTAEGLPIPSLLFSCGTLILTWRLGRYVIRGWALAFALIVLSLLGYFQWQAILIRGYALEAFVTVACWLVIGRLGNDETPSFARWMPIFAGLACIGILVHGLFVLQLIAMALFLVLNKPAKRKLYWLGAYLIPPLLVLGMLSSLQTENVGTFTPGGPTAWIGSLITAGFGTNRVVRLILLLAVLLGLWLVVRARMLDDHRPKDRLWLIPILWSIIPAIGLGVGSFAMNLFNPRYLLPCLPGLALLLAMSVEGLTHCPTENWCIGVLPARGVAFGIVAVVLASFALGQTATSSFDDSHSREMVAMIQSRSEPGDCLYFSTDALDSAGGVARPPFEAEWVTSATHERLKVISSPRPLGEVLRTTPTYQLETSLRLARRCERIWVVRHDLGDGRSPDAFVSGLVRDHVFTVAHAEHWSNLSSVSLLERAR